MGRSSSTPGLVESTGRVPLEEMWLPPLLKPPPYPSTPGYSPSTSPGARTLFWLSGSFTLAASLFNFMGRGILSLTNFSLGVSKYFKTWAFEIDIYKGYWTGFKQ
ncbi:hypothetical protein SK128_011420 [Halocaridina rubra]|uniref:Uncharacterized protein n=1 Tax=Halocaridina rubra TaxID=373956 RepID=A0AAN8ZT36_HALRR